MAQIDYPQGKYNAGVQGWLDWINADQSLDALGKLLADDAVFFSPVVHTGQKGRGLCIAYLSGAMQVLHDGFRYLDIFDNGNKAALVFECKLDDIIVNGVDLIEWNDAGEIVEFKVMIRPLKAIQTLIPKMAAMLEQAK